VTIDLLLLEVSSLAAKMQQVIRWKSNEVISGPKGNQSSAINPQNFAANVEYIGLGPQLFEDYYSVLRSHHSGGKVLST